MRRSTDTQAIRRRKRLLPVALAGLIVTLLFASSAEASAERAPRAFVFQWGTYAGHGIQPAGTLGAPKPTQLGAGQGFIVLLDRKGDVWTWGTNRYGELGNGTLNPVATPSRVNGLSGI